MPADTSSSLDFKSIEQKDELNSDVWINDGTQLNPEVRKNLIKIALRFYKELDIPQAHLEDIVFTGSLANYNWSKYSDVDLHLIVDYKEVAPDVDLVRNYLKARKSLWNDEHDIKIFGFDVEVYVQDANEPHYATGQYSIMNDEWLVKPKPGKPEIDKDAIKRKAKFLMKMIDDVKDMFNKKEYRQAINDADKLQTKIRNMRSYGLEKNGEYSSENLAFKLLRRNKYIEKLYDIETKAYDALMTI